jgi:preprotein translocase subunit Sss1
MKINRFPKMAALQRFRAERLGFDVNTAKAIGITEATKYAIFKNLSYKRRVEREKDEVKKTYLGKKNLDEETFKIFKLQALDGLPFVGNKIYTAEDYDRYFSRFDEKIKETIEDWAKNLIETCDKNVLENETKFFNLCWKPHRDELSEV